MNIKKRFGHWKDTAVKLEGEAVRSFTVMFLQMWYMTEAGEGEYEKYLPHFEAPSTSGYVIPYNDDPINRLDIAESVYLDMLYKAKKYVHIMTPYLIIDNELITALTYAARCGCQADPASYTGQKDYLCDCKDVLSTAVGGGRKDLRVYTWLCACQGICFG